MNQIEICIAYCEGYEQARSGFPCLKNCEVHKQGFNDFFRRNSLRYRQAKYFLSLNGLNFR